jgi:hypothetical protein
MARREIWRPVVGWARTHEVSSLGRVRRAAYGQLFPGRILKLQRSRKGYPSAALCVRGKHATKLVHALVAAAFIGPRPRGLQLDHIDGVKTNNRPSNLQYVTCQENIRRAMKLGLRAKFKGESHGMAKLTNADVRAIRKAHRAGETQTALGPQYGVTQANISEIVNRKTWSHVR